MSSATIYAADLIAKTKSEALGSTKAASRAMRRVRVAGCQLAGLAQGTSNTVMYLGAAIGAPLMELPLIIAPGLVSEKPLSAEVIE